MDLDEMVKWQADRHAAMVEAHITGLLRCGISIDEAVSRFQLVEYRVSPFETRYSLRVTEEDAEALQEDAEQGGSDD